MCIDPDQAWCEQFEGSLPLGAKHRAATLYSVGSARDPAMKQSMASAARLEAVGPFCRRHWSYGVVRVTATSNRYA